MANSNLLLDIEQNVKCPVCLEVFIDPVMLECQHSLCKRCVNVLMIFNRVNCPQCRTVTNASKLKDNLLQKTFVEVFNKSQQEVKRLVCNRRGKKRDAEGRNIVSENDDSPTVETDDDLCDLCKSFKAELYCSDCKNMVCKACQQCHRIFTCCKDVSVKSLSETISVNNELIQKKLAEVREVIDTVNNKFDSIILERQEERFALFDKVGELRTHMLRRVRNYCDYLRDELIDQAADECIAHLSKANDEVVRKLEDGCQKELEEVKANIVHYKPQYIENIIANANEAMKSAKECEIPSCKVVFHGTCKKFPQFSMASRVFLVDLEGNKNQDVSLHQLTYRKFYLKEKIALSTTLCSHIFVYQDKIWVLSGKKLECVDIATLKVSDDYVYIREPTIQGPMDITIHKANVYISALNALYVFNGKKVTRLIYGHYHCVNVLEDGICVLDTHHGKIRINLLSVTEDNGVTNCDVIEEVLTELPTPRDNKITSVAFKGKLFICSTIFSCIYVTDVKTGKTLEQISAEHLGFQCPKDWPSLGPFDGRYVLISGLGHNLKLCDLTDPCYPVYTVDIMEGRSHFVSACLLRDSRLICLNGPSLCVYD